MAEHELKYMSSEAMYEGVIVELHDGSVGIDLKGRLGHLSIPKRMIISNYELKLGQEVGFLMSYPEVFDDEPKEEYVNAIKHRNKLKKRNAKTPKVNREEKHCYEFNSF